MKGTRAIAILACAGGLAACAPKPLILKGPRFDTRTPIAEVMADAGKGGNGNVEQVVPNRSEPISLGAPVANADWTQRNGNAEHNFRQPALNGPLSPLWAAKIGKGNDKRNVITAAPVVAGGRIFTLDSIGNVTATATNGARVWSAALTPPGESAKSLSGGGLAYGDGKLFATSAYGELVAMDPASGRVLWRTRFSAPVAGAPTVEGNRVYVAARDSSGWAIDTRDGKIVWHVDGATPDGGVTGGAAPALSARFAIMPLPGGQILGLVRSGGTQVWSTPVVGERLGQGYASMSDITGDPVVVGNTIYVGNSGGQLSALDGDDGTQIWTKREGVAGPVWPAGNSIFVVSDQAKLQRLDARTGDKIWAVDLPYYVPVKKRKNRLAIYVNYGPIIAGNRLWVSCSDGVLRGFDPASGKQVASVALGAGAASAPVVAGGVLYVVTEDGQLRAFR